MCIFLYMVVRSPYHEHFHSILKIIYEAVCYVSPYGYAIPLLHFYLLVSYFTYQPAFFITYINSSVLYNIGADGVGIAARSYLSYIPFHLFTILKVLSCTARNIFIDQLVIIYSVTYPCACLSGQDHILHFFRLRSLLYSTQNFVSTSALWISHSKV